MDGWVGECSCICGSGRMDEKKKARKKRVITKKFVIIHHHRETEGSGEKKEKL